MVLNEYMIFSITVFVVMTCYIYYFLQIQWKNFIEDEVEPIMYLAKQTNWFIEPYIPSFYNIEDKEDEEIC